MFEYMRILIFMFILICCACTEVKEELFIRMSFQDVFTMTQENEKDVLFLLTHRECHACDILKEMIQDDEDLKNHLLEKYKCFENPVDVVGYNFLPQLLHEYGFPIIVVFSPQGDLKSIVGGAAITDKELETKLGGEIFQTNLPNKLQLTDSAYSYLISATAKAFLSYSKADYSKAKDEIEESISVHSYFYNLYLAAKIAQVKNDSLNASVYVEKALRINDKFNDFLYQYLREELSYISGKNMKYATLQYAIVFKDKVHDCGIVKGGKDYNFSYEFKNIDTIPILIKNVHKSCNCMEVTWDKKPVLPGKTGYINVKYDTSHKGVFAKGLFVNINRDDRIIPLYVKGCIE